MSEQEQKSLYERLFEVAQSVDRIAKTGHNQKHGYDFVEAANVLATIRAELLERRILMVPSATNVRHLTDTGGKQFVTTVDLSYRFIDIDNPAEVIVIAWVGAGADIGGEKGLYKAYTGGLKYALLNFFMIPTGDDPERDQTSESGQGHTAVDAARPAATTIPADRAKAILAKAIEVGLATEGDGKVALSSVLKAKLAEVGVSSQKIGHLNVDQAEDVEAFLAQEAASA